MPRCTLSLIALVGFGIIPTSTADSGEPSFSTLCPMGFALGLPYEAEGRRHEPHAPWKLFLGGEFVQALIVNADEWAQILCFYGGDNPPESGSQSPGSYRLQLVREGQKCRFIAAVNARIEQLQSNLGGSTTRFACNGARDACVAICD